jgi:hypothetical protein
MNASEFNKTHKKPFLNPPTQKQVDKKERQRLVREAIDKITVKVKSDNVYIGMHEDYIRIQFEGLNFELREVK